MDLVSVTNKRIMHNERRINESSKRRKWTLQMASGSKRRILTSQIASEADNERRNGRQNVAMASG